MTATSATARVVIADDSGIFRQGLRLLLEAGGVDVLSDCADVTSLLAAVRTLRPDACVVDIRMPPTHTDEGIRAAQQIKAEFPDIGVLVLSTYTDTTWADTLLADGLGGTGYLLKDRVNDGAELIAAVQRVASGGTAVDPAIVSALIHRQDRSGPLSTLTDRERDVLALMAQGRSNRGIAEHVFVSPRTVEAHVAAVFDKLGLHADTTAGADNRRVLAVLAYLQQH